MAVYKVSAPQALQDSTDWWIRPVSMFEEEVTGPDGVRQPRFVRVSD